MLPEVGSTMVPPGFKSPAFSPASIMAIPIRSLTEEPGLNDSTLAARVAPWGEKRPSFTRGVLPRVSRMFS